MQAAIDANQRLRWVFVQRGFWVKAPTKLMTFTAAEGAGGHQETLNRALAETRILDWLDEALS
jgi:hypothetical protein